MRSTLPPRSAAVLVTSCAPLTHQTPPPTARRRRRLRRTDTIRHLAALDALQPAEHLLRLGWVVVAGTVEVGGHDLTCCFPLVSQPVHVSVPALRRVTLTPTGASELTPLVQDPEVAAGLEAGGEYGSRAADPVDDAGPGDDRAAVPPERGAWITAVVAASGLPP